MDVVAIARIEAILSGPPGRAERFLARCFTPAEQRYCEGARDRAARYAARFAAKEAASKALGAPAGIRFLDVEVVRAEGAPPMLRLDGVAAETARALGATRLLVTVTHDGGVAAATVVVEGRP
jgi:holo-[acyl-carrier protein] synthase